MQKRSGDNGMITYPVYFYVLFIPLSLYEELRGMRNSLFQAIVTAFCQWTIFELNLSLLFSLETSKYILRYKETVLLLWNEETVLIIIVQAFRPIKSISRINIWHNSNIVTKYFHYMSANIYLISMISLILVPSLKYLFTF